jgi:hypothetical protein
VDIMGTGSREVVTNKLALLLLLALPACASQERLAQERAEKDQHRAELLSQIEAACASAGYTPGTHTYLNCLHSQAGKEGYAMVVAANGSQATLQPTIPIGVGGRYDESSAAPKGGPVVLATPVAVAGGMTH